MMLLKCHNQQCNDSSIRHRHHRDCHHLTIRTIVTIPIVDLLLLIATYMVIFHTSITASISSIRVNVHRLAIAIVVAVVVFSAIVLIHFVTTFSDKQRPTADAHLIVMADWTLESEQRYQSRKGDSCHRLVDLPMFNKVDPKL